MPKWPTCALLFATLALAACGESATIPAKDGYGADPALPAPIHSWFPTIDVAKATGWTPGATPKAPPGFTVAALATGLAHPRWLYVLPNGDILVAETNTPPKPESHGIRAMIARWVMGRAGAGVKSPNRITLLRDDGAGHVERGVFLDGLHSPFGMALVGNTLYVADTDALLKFPYKGGDTKITARPTKVTDLPAGPIDHHWTKDVAANKDGSKLYVTVGSNSNVAENGIEAEKDRADVLEVDPTTGTYQVFASGLRNPSGLSWQPQSGALWVAVNERDELGSDLVPDYMTALKDGAFYGWPYSYFGQHVDERVSPQRPDLVAKAIVPDYALGAHTASLGLTFYDGHAFPSEFEGGAFVGQHGSWNRKPRSGYAVIFVPFKDGKPAGPPRDFLTGFLTPDGDAQGRPVGVKIDKMGALLVADDVGNTVWRVTRSAAAVN